MADEIDSTRMYYTVREIAAKCNVDKTTIYKILSPQAAVIPTSMWVRLPSSHIRIHRDALSLFGIKSK